MIALIAVTWFGMFHITMNSHYLSTTCNVNGVVPIKGSFLGMWSTYLTGTFEVRFHWECLHSVLVLYFGV